MSLLDKISLLVTPNAVKASKLYSVIPASGTGDLAATRNTTATRVNSLGLIESVAANVPRLNYDSVQGEPSVLLEPQRTNVLIYSQDYTQNNWIKDGNILVTPNNAISPSGVLNATLVENILSSSNSTFLRGDVNNGSISGQTFSGFIFVKAPTQTQVGKTLRVLLQRTSGTFVSSENTVTLTNDWQKLIVPPMTGLSGSDGVSIRLNNSGTADKVLIWGMQIEQGSHATSYIPTLGSAVTRNQDLVSKTGISDLIGQTEGTIFLETAVLSNDSTFKSFCISDGTSANRLFIGYTAPTNQMAIGGTSQGIPFSQGINFILTNSLLFNKIALKYTSNKINIFINGVKLASEINGQSLPINLSRFGLDSGGGGSPFFGKVNGLQIYKTALTDAECITLTT